MKRRDEVLVGLLTLVTVAGGVAGMVWLARGGLSGGYPLYAQFPWGAGLKVGQPVLFSGVNIGFVDAVDLLENGGLVVKMRVYKNKRVPLGTTATVEANGIFGDMDIGLRAKAPTNQFHVKGDTLPSGPMAPGIADILARVDTLGQSVAKLINGLHKELIDDQLIGTLRKTVGRADSMLKAIGSLATKQSDELTKTQDMIRTKLEVINKAQIDSTLNDLRGGVKHATMFIDSLSSTNTRVKAILAKLESGSGSAARLLNDPKLFDSLVEDLAKLKEFMADFMANPRKYIRISIF